MLRSACAAASRARRGGGMLCTSGAAAGRGHGGVRGRFLRTRPATPLLYLARAGRNGAVDSLHAPVGCLTCKIAGCTFTGGDAIKYALLLTNGDAALHFVCPGPVKALAAAHAALKSEGKQLVPMARRSEPWHVAIIAELCKRKADRKIAVAGGAAKA
jgi:hypothetical protein